MSDEFNEIKLILKFIFKSCLVILITASAISVLTIWGIAAALKHLFG